MAAKKAPAKRNGAKKAPGPPFGWDAKRPFKDDGKGETVSKWHGLTFTTKYNNRGTYSTQIRTAPTLGRLAQRVQGNVLPGSSGRTRAEAIRQTKKLFPQMAAKRNAARRNATRKRTCAKSRVVKNTKLAKKRSGVNMATRSWCRNFMNLDVAEKDLGSI